MNMNDISAHWVALHEALGLGMPIADELHYERMLGIAGRLMESFDDRPDNPLGGLIELVGGRIRDYEVRVHPWPDNSTPATRLAFLMAQQGLNQSDLAEVGPQSVVSAILSGKRTINLRQAKALAARFGVPLDVFA